MSMLELSRVGKIIISEKNKPTKSTYIVIDTHFLLPSNVLISIL